MAFTVDRKRNSLVICLWDIVFGLDGKGVVSIGFFSFSSSTVRWLLWAR